MIFTINMVNIINWLIGLIELGLYPRHKPEYCRGLVRVAWAENQSKKNA